MWRGGGEYQYYMGSLSASRECLGKVEEEQSNALSSWCKHWWASRTYASKSQNHRTETRTQAAENTVTSTSKFFKTTPEATLDAMI